MILSIQSLMLTYMYALFLHTLISRLLERSGCSEKKTLLDVQNIEYHANDF